MTKRNKKILIWVTVAIILVACLFLITKVINQKQEEDQRAQNLLLDLECWANGESSDCGPWTSMRPLWINDYWKYSDPYEIVKEKINEIIGQLKNDPQKLFFFIKEFNDHIVSPYDQSSLDISDLGLKDALINANLSFEGKLLTELALSSDKVFNINRGDMYAYIDKQETKTIHFDNASGGYYADRESEYSREKIGENLSLYDVRHSYPFGDFLRIHYYGRRLNFQTYKEEDYDYSLYYFKGTPIDFDPYECDCYYTGEYLYAIGDSIYVYHLEDPEFQGEIE